MTKLRIKKNPEGDVSVFLNDMELEQLEAVELLLDTRLPKPKIRLTLVVPEIEIDTTMEDIQLTADAYKRCEVCGRWITPSIESNLKEKVVTAKYVCNNPLKDGTTCTWKKSMEIQNWNNGIKRVNVDNGKDDLNGGK